MNKYFLIILAGLLLPAFISAQSIKRAQKLMDKYEYSKAVGILKQAAGNEKTRVQAIPLLAECYRLQHDIFNTKAWYGKAVALSGAKPITYFYYARALQATGEYKMAREMYSKYAALEPSDSRGKIFVSHCDSVLGPWNALKPAYEIKNVNRINTAQSDFGPALYNGELIFASDHMTNPADSKKYGWTGRGYLNLMKSEPSAPGEYYGEMEAPARFDPKFNQAYHDGPAAFSSDGNSIYYTRAYYGKAKREGIYKTNLLKIYYATKSNGNWSEVKPFFLNSTDYSIGHPTLSADGQSLYFVSDMPGGQGGTDIWMCKREEETWGPAVNLGPTVNTTENEMFPTMRDDGELYFASEGLPGYGALDMFKTRMVNGKWTTPENLQPPLNGSFDDFAIAFAPGDKNGFFSSNRPGGVGNDDIYAFRKLEPPTPVVPPAVILPAYLSGLVKDKTTLLPIAGATVFLFNPASGKVKILKTDAQGMYKTRVENPAEFTAKAMMTNYIADCTPFPVTEVKPGATILAPRDLLLDQLSLNKTFRIDNIYYDFDKYNIREDAKPELDKLVRIMKENAIIVELGSHTDCRGSFAYNDKLSQNRAESAVRYIISTGIDKGRITAKGYGEHQLTNKCADGVDCTPAEHQANRRTEFKVTGFISSETRPEYDLSKFVDGEELSVYLFSPDFFANCLQDKMLPKAEGQTDKNTVSTPLDPKVQTIVSTPFNEEKQIKEAVKANPPVTAVSPAKTKPTVTANPTIKEPKPAVTANPVVKANSSTVTYSVNLYALNKEKSLQDPEFKDLDNIQMYRDGGKYKYTSGVFATRAEAARYQIKVVKLGFKDAFIVTFSDGKRIY